MMAPAMDATFFASPAEFREWLERNHETASEVWVGFHKTKTGKASLTWPESVDEALCFGWIDAVRKRIDDDSYMIRFTRRKPGSIWSLVNVRKVEELVRSAKKEPGKKAASSDAEATKKSASVRDLETRLGRRFGARVEVRDKKGAGELAIKYGSLDELDRILGILGPL